MSDSSPFDDAPQYEDAPEHEEHEEKEEEEEDDPFADVPQVSSSAGAPSLESQEPVEDKETPLR